MSLPNEFLATVEKAEALYKKMVRDGRGPKSVANAVGPLLAEAREQYEKIPPELRILEVVAKYESLPQVFAEGGPVAPPPAPPAPPVDDSSDEDDEDDEDSDS